MADLAAFTERVGGFLVADEVVHNLILGILGDLAEPPAGPVPFAGDPVLGLVEGDQGVEAVGVMTPPRNLVVSRAATVGALEALARGLATRQVDIPGVDGPAAEARIFASAWRSHTLQPAERVRTLEICVARAVHQPAAMPSGALRPAGPGDVDLVASWITAFNEEALSAGGADPALARRAAEDLVTNRRRSLAIWEDAGPVSMAATGGRTARGARVFAVYTPPAQRRKGYASAVVAAVTRQVLDTGRRYCCLFFDLANPTAGHIYRALGYVPLAPFDDYRFGA